MSGKRYPEEFKTEAVKQVVDRGYSVASVATRLDITTHSLYAWIKKYGPDSSRGLRSNGTETYDNGINMLYLKCFYLGLTLSGTKTYVKV
ncbi:transposase [Enterobacter roggenkampii]|nr:transposase [Enterobacter roggenkampii]MDH2557317.1 transposase [Enterobacter roggenkampii]